MTQLVTGATRAKIVHTVMQLNRPWKGTRRGVAMVFIQSSQQTLLETENRIGFTAKWKPRHSLSGSSPSVWDAIREIETAVERSKRKESKQQ